MINKMTPQHTSCDYYQLTISPILRRSQAIVPIASLDDSYRVS